MIFNFLKNLLIGVFQSSKHADGGNFYLERKSVEKEDYNSGSYEG